MLTGVCWDEEEAIVIFNTADSPARFSLELPAKMAASYSVAWPKVGGQTYGIGGGKLEVIVPAREAVVLVGYGSAAWPN